MNHFSIPALTYEGFLPPGLYDCSVEEIVEVFGSFTSTDRRVNLFLELRSYILDALGTGLVASIIVDGSFVTGVDYPNDIDVVVVVKSGLEVGRELRPSDYNILSRRIVRKRHRIDILVARENGSELTEYLQFFSQVRGRPELKKGMLRVFA